ncbi:MAG TPA: SCP2 sterol-binding domain-containing protein [Telluria sp.]|nr:SCP2 sterol-binding domain-containing protein [Telluria sp.]
MTSTVLLRPAVAAINHLLAQEAWARDALALHAGKEALIDGGSLALRLVVGRDGMVDQSRAEGPANVTIRVRLADLPLMAQDRERAFSYVKIEGDADFANTINQLAKGLRWEAEHDLEPFLGPIGSRRLAQGARSAFGAIASTHRKLAENVAEFLLEEQPTLVRKESAADFGEQVARLRDDVERAAKRIAKLEQRLAPKAAAATSQQKLDFE